MKSVRVWKGLALILENFSALVHVIIKFGAIRGNLFTFFHPLRSRVLVGAGHEGEGILFGLGALHEELRNLFRRIRGPIWNAVTQKVPQGWLTRRISRQGFSNPLQCGRGTAGANGKFLFDEGCDALKKDLRRFVGRPFQYQKCASIEEPYIHTRCLGDIRQ